MNKETIIQNFDPNSVASKRAQVFGLPFNEAQSDLVLFPVPWDATVSYREGTHKAPEAIFEASMQVDLLDKTFGNFWKKGIFMRPVSTEWSKINQETRKKAQGIIRHLEKGKSIKAGSSIEKTLIEVNQTCEKLHAWVEKETFELLKQGKKVGLVGGDHSTPLGFIRALAKIHQSFGILQIDAHADLRKAFEGFTYSHASVMYNVLLTVPQLSRLVQIGVRDFCQEEVNIIQEHNRVVTFFDEDIKNELYTGKTWSEYCDAIIAALPEKVYISFDIDGLNPALCPNTGTPVPGGFDFEQIVFLFKKIKDSQKEIIGFDLNEVIPSKTEWDSIVGARVLFKLCGLALS
ncbi:MAG: agmatinase family protein [Bacteroidia bacterium]|nr:agmatinase family protein [Bacteroidia bacterium]MDW8301117.1 agmatinase family protein [Bacteroidia bacterium]